MHGSGPRRRGHGTGAAVLPALLFAAVLVTLPSAGPVTTYLRTVGAAQPAQGQPAQGQPAQGQPSDGTTATTGPVQRIERQVTFHVPGGAVRAGMVAYVVLVLAGVGIVGGFLYRRRRAGDAPPPRPLSGTSYSHRPAYPVAPPASGAGAREQLDPSPRPPAAWGLPESPRPGDSAR